MKIERDGEEGFRWLLRFALVFGTALLFCILYLVAVATYLVVH